MRLVDEQETAEPQLGGVDREPDLVRRPQPQAGPVAAEFGDDADPPHVRGDRPDGRRRAERRLERSGRADPQAQQQFRDPDDRQVEIKRQGELEAVRRGRVGAADVEHAVPVDHREVERRAELGRQHLAQEAVRVLAGHVDERVGDPDTGTEAADRELRDAVVEEVGAQEQQAADPADREGAVYERVAVAAGDVGAEPDDVERRGRADREVTVVRLEQPQRHAAVGVVQPGRVAEPQRDVGVGAGDPGPAA